MKTLALLFLPLSLHNAATGFVQQQCSVLSRSSVRSSKSADDIAHELEDLGLEIKHQVMRNDVIHGSGFDELDDGFDRLHEPEVFKLKRRLRDLKHQWHEDRKHLEAMEKRIVQLEESLKKNQLEWETEENQLLSDMFEHEKEESESFRKLFGKIFKLAGRRIKNGFKRVFRFTHTVP